MSKKNERKREREREREREIFKGVICMENECEGSKEGLNVSNVG